MPLEFKKMAGTAAVFVLADQHANSPVEREGMVWNSTELHLNSLPAQLNRKMDVATNLALEGLEEYDPPAHGDVRHVTALNTEFVYIQPIQGWVEFARP